mmetsp:Transcript_8228/g.27347  ORF Transcript_8228/g.27347 Transcript_8228/m.27347 type:complete len:209 (-) Transcript_8228:1303-1929(-)
MEGDESAKLLRGVTSGASFSSPTDEVTFFVALALSGDWLLTGTNPPADSNNGTGGNAPPAGRSLSRSRRSFFSALISRIFSVKIVSSLRKSSLASVNKDFVSVNSSVNVETCRFSDSTFVLSWSYPVFKREGPVAPPFEAQNSHGPKSRAAILPRCENFNSPSVQSARFVYAASRASFGSRFTFGLFLMFRARWAYFRVFKVSSMLLS